MNEITNFKHEPLSSDLADELAFDVIMGLKRPFFIAEFGYEKSEKEFGQDNEDPYIAIEYDPSNIEHVRLGRNSSVRKCIGIINKFAEGQSLTPEEQSFFDVGYNFIGGTGDFLIEALYPLSAYIYAKDAFLNNEYMTDHSGAADALKLLLFKFLTRYMMKHDDNDYMFGLDAYLGIYLEKFTFKQLAVMLGFETERTARGLALASTPQIKRIEIYKADGNRTFIEKKVFIDYVTNHNKTRTIEQGDNEMSVEIKLTGGNIRNNHIYLTKVMSLFPDCYIGGSKKADMANSTLKLDVGNGKYFDTDIAGDKKIFRTREGLRAFFEHFDLTEGDSVILSTATKGNYKLRPKK